MNLHINQDILFVSGCLERPPGASGFSQMDKHTVEPAVCCYQKKIYVFGGKNFWTHETDGRKLLCYDTTTGNCERIPLDKSRWPMGRSGARGVVYEDSWYLYGGELDERGSTQNLFWKFHFPTRKWSKINPKVCFFFPFNFSFTPLFLFFFPPFSLMLFQFVLTLFK